MLLPGRIAPHSTGSRAWLQAGAYASVLPAPARGIPATAGFRPPTRQRRACITGVPGRADGALALLQIRPPNLFAVRSGSYRGSGRILEAIDMPIRGIQDQQFGGWAHACYQRV
jgi:hypothetical protein